MSSPNYRFLSGRTELGTGSIGLMAVTKELSLARAAKRAEDGVEEGVLAEPAGDAPRLRTWQPALSLFRGVKQIWCWLGSSSFSASAGTTAFPHGPQDMGRWGGGQGKGLLSQAEAEEGESAGKTAAKEKITSALRGAVGAHQCRGAVRTPVAGGCELAAASSPMTVSG